MAGDLVETMDFFDDRIDEPVEVEADGAEQLKRLSGLVLAQIKVEDEIDALNQQLSEKAKELERLRANLVPELMNELSMKKLTMADGSTVELKRIVNANLPKDDGERDKCFAWLREIKSDDLIKNDVTIQFGRGEDEKATAFVTHVREDFQYDVQQKVGVNPQSLSALVRSLREEGKEVSPHLSLYEADISKIKRPKPDAPKKSKSKKK